MPDWSYHPLFKPLLFQLPAATARRLTLTAISTLDRLPGGHLLLELMGHMKPYPELARTVFGITFPSPVGLSGRVDPDLLATSALSRFGFGWIEIGPIASTAEAGAAEVVLAREEEAILYRGGAQGIDVEQVVERLKRQKKAVVPLAVHVAGSQAVQLMERTRDDADLYIFAGTVGEYRSVKEKFAQTPVLYALDGELPAEDGVTFDGIYLDDRMPVEGGLRDDREGKGRALARLGALKSSGVTVPIVVSGGIYEPQDAIDLLDAGADLVLLSSGFVYSGPGLPKRINEAVLDELRKRELPRRAAGSDRSGTPGWFSWFLMGLGVLIAGLLALVVGLTDVMLAHDEEFLGLSREAVSQWNPELFQFMSHDRITLAGIMISAGLLFAQLAWHKVRRGERWAIVLFAVAAGYGFLNFLYSFFVGYVDAWHLLYNALILPFYIWGLWRTKEVSLPHGSTNRQNSKAWQRSQIGQLMFVLLGGALLTAGVVISLIGMGDVFVQEDLCYIGVAPEEIDRFNQRLIPLIAHDRAGFGGALICEGLLLLLISLWGYREGERWLWWSYLLGGFAGLAAGIGVHLKIGYIDFYHLLPAYIALALYLLGLYFSHAYLCKRKPPR